MNDAVTAVTPLLKRFEQWRIDHGRDPRTGRPRRGRLKMCDVDPKRLIAMALEMAARDTNRDDLRPLYRELAGMFKEHLEEPTDGTRQEA